MQDGNGATRRHRRTAASAIGLAAAAIVLAACSSTPSSIGTNTNDVFGGSPASGQAGGGGAATTTANPASVSITPTSGTTQFNPATPIVVKASNGTLTSVTVTNTTKGTHVTGELSADKATWTSNEDLGYGAKYAVAAVAADSAGKSVTQNSTVSTLSPAKVVYPNMIPAPASVTSIGVGYPGVFLFD